MVQLPSAAWGTHEVVTKRKTARFSIGEKAVFRKKRRQPPLVCKKRMGQLPSCNDHFTYMNNYFTCWVEPFPKP